MKSLIILFSCLFVISCKKEKAHDYYQEIKKHQYEQNVEFSDANTSPLKQSDFVKFRSLSFFEVDPLYKTEATLEKRNDTLTLEIQTTTDKVSLYKIYAIAKFKLGGTPFELPIYESVPQGFDPRFISHLFLPFTDLTNGKQTYKAGRYLDIEKTNSNSIILDFNKSYNPYCAYNDDFSCPIPPKENHLDIAIKAGEMNFKQ